MAKWYSPSGFKSLIQILQEEKGFDLLRESLNNYEVVEDFAVIFPELSKIAKAVRVEKKVLFLKVENSVWKSELNFQKNLLIEKINKHYNEAVIKTIKFL